MVMILPGWSWVLLFSVQMTLLPPLAATSSSVASGVTTLAKPGCRDKCGNLTIPYPFGIGRAGCYHAGFKVACVEGRTYLHNASSNIVIADISLLEAQLRIYEAFNWNCYSSNGRTRSPALTSYFPHPFTTSSKKNRLTAVGCNTLAIMERQNGRRRASAACISVCQDKQSVDKAGQCSGAGCCQTNLARNLIINFTVTLDVRFDNSMIADFNPCSYVFLVEKDWYIFNASDLEGENLKIKYKDGFPIVMDWVVGHEACGEAMMNGTSYACRSRNSQCINSPNAPAGYLCNCSDGYTGNPYLEQGCLDIDECKLPDQYPCHGICRNTQGGYNCLCSPGTHSEDPRSKPCDLNPPSETKMIIGLAVGIGVATSIGVITLVIGYVLLAKRIRLRREAKQRAKNFTQNHGVLLQQLIVSHHDTAERTKIFSLKELKKATDNFDEIRILGHGGHGMVYKGILSDLRVVAIKVSKITVQREIDQFINEVAILSHINHRNIVKLFGCCLETEVPLLVYEFIQNGSLYHHLHAPSQNSLSWKDRLRIALETAKAIAYLHSAASMSIFHRDIKSSNILLDDNLTAKVSDFGASRFVPVDQTSIRTCIQGTYGYLDPEYYYTSRLTDKSDVYSYGVLLVELLTRENPTSYSRVCEGRNLVAQFTSLVLENRFSEILDKQIIEEGWTEEAEEAATLAAACLRLKGEERISMRQVELKLEAMHGWRNQLQCFLIGEGGFGASQDAQRNPLTEPREGNTRQYSLEDELHLSLEYRSR